MKALHKYKILVIVTLFSLGAPVEGFNPAHGSDTIEEINVDKVADAAYDAKEVASANASAQPNRAALQWRASTTALRGATSSISSLAEARSHGAEAKETIHTADQAGIFISCEDLDFDPEYQDLLKRFKDKSVTIGDESVSQLTCLGGGVSGIAFKGESTTTSGPLMVKFFPSPSGSIASKIASEQFKISHSLSNFVSENAGATGADTFVSAIADGDAIADKEVREDPTPYGQVWEYFDGSNLRQLERQKKATSEEWHAIERKVCEGLIFMWKAGIVHGDLQLANVMWNAETGALKFVDYDDLRAARTNDQLGKLGSRAARHRTASNLIDSGLVLSKIGAHQAGTLEMALRLHKSYTDVFETDNLDNFVNFYKERFHVSKVVFPESTFKVFLSKQLPEEREELENRQFPEPQTRQ